MGWMTRMPLCGGCGGGSCVCVSVCLCVSLTAGERRHSAGSVALPARTNPAGAEEAAALQMTTVASHFFWGLLGGCSFQNLGNGDFKCNLSLDRGIGSTDSLSPLRT